MAFDMLVAEHDFPTYANYVGFGTGARYHACWRPVVQHNVFDRWPPDVAQEVQVMWPTTEFLFESNGPVD